MRVAATLVLAFPVENMPAKRAGHCRPQATMTTCRRMSGEVLRDKVERMDSLLEGQKSGRNDADGSRTPHLPSFIPARLVA